MPKNFSRAFTLFELTLVVGVIAIIAAIAYPGFITALERAKVAKDMNNLHQIGLATQLYMNDHDGGLPGVPTDPINGRWMSQLCPKYTATWGIFKSPFDTRPPSEVGDASTPISYGINSKIYANNVAISADKITKPTVFILFAPAQDSANLVEFQGTAASVAPGVTLTGNSNTVTSTPPNSGVPLGGTQNNRTRINALFADLHCETMFWTTFTNTTPSTADPSADLRWTPYLPYP